MERKKLGKTMVRLNTIILTKLKVKPIKDVALPTRYKNNLIGDAIRLGTVYVCDYAHDKIFETIFARE